MNSGAKNVEEKLYWRICRKSQELMLYCFNVLKLTCVDPHTAVWYGVLQKAKTKLYSFCRSSLKYCPDFTQSSQSTLRKSAKGAKMRQPVAALVDDTTTVVFSFCDEQFPYRTKIPGSQVTLRKFKEYLPKKGNYRYVTALLSSRDYSHNTLRFRYFFKTECEELDNQVIQEEVSNDNDVIPLYEGRIMGQVKSID